MSWLVALGVLIMALNIHATARLARAASYSRRQSILQQVLIWTLPVLGAGLVLAVMTADRAKANPVRDTVDPESAVPRTDTIGPPFDGSCGADPPFGGH